MYAKYNIPLFNGYKLKVTSNVHLIFMKKKEMGRQRQKPYAPDTNLGMKK